MIFALVNNFVHFPNEDSSFFSYESIFSLMTIYNSTWANEIIVHGIVWETLEALTAKLLFALGNQVELILFITLSLCNVS